MSRNRRDRRTKSGHSSTQAAMTTVDRLAALLDDLTSRQAEATALQQQIAHETGQLDSILSLPTCLFGPSGDWMHSQAKENMPHFQRQAVEIAEVRRSQAQNAAEIRHQIIRIIAAAYEVGERPLTAAEWLAEHRPVAVHSSPRGFYVLTPDHEASPEPPATKTSLLHSLNLTIVEAAA